MNPKFTDAVRAAFPDHANIVLDIIRGSRDYALTFAAAAQRDRESYHPHETVTLKLEALNEVLEGYGVEYIAAGRGSKSPAFEYINFGGTYDTTIVYFPGRRTWRVTCWGDIVERGNYA